MFPYDYEVIRSDRKTLALTITPAGKLIVRAPMNAPDALILLFVDSKSGWIESHLKKLSARKEVPPFTKQELKTLADAARKDLPRRVARWAPEVGVTWNRVAIRAQRSRWGSSSNRGNLNFNCLLMLVPEDVRDYVVVHELCHQKQMNHSPRFWAEVARVMPDYRRRLQWLNTEGAALIARLENTPD